MDRAVSCSATMMGVRYTAQELWDFLKASESFIEDGAVKPGIPGVDDATAAFTEFCELLLAARPELENAELPLHFEGQSLDVVFTKRSAYLGRLLMPRCILLEEDIPADLKVPQDQVRDPAEDQDIYDRRVEFVEDFCQGNECCPNPSDQPAVVGEMTCDELDLIVDSIRTEAVDKIPGTIEIVEDLLKTRIHFSFQRVEIVRTLNGTHLSVDSTARIAAALEIGESFSNELNLIRLQLEQEGSFERPTDEDEAQEEAAAIIRGIDETAREGVGVGLPRTSPVRQIIWTTLTKWSRPEPNPPGAGMPSGIKMPKTVGPEF